MRKLNMVVAGVPGAHAYFADANRLHDRQGP